MWKHCSMFVVCQYWNSSLKSSSFVTKFEFLRVRLFWGKMISGNHFPPNPRVWQQQKMKFSGNSLPVDRNLRLWPGNEVTFSFSLQFISGKRERERGREKRESPDRRKREEEETSPAIAPLVDRRAARLTSSAIVRRARSSIAIVDRATRRTIAPISPPISPSPRDLIFSSAARSQFDRIWWIFLLGFAFSMNECGID